MLSRPSPRMRILVPILLLGLLSVPADAQTLFSRPYEPNQLAVETIVPNADDASGGTGALFITGTASLSENIEVAAELPIARSAANGGSSSTVGNPYLGVGLSSTNVPVLLELGARFPTASDNRAAATGRAANFGRTPAFGRDEFVLSALLNGRRELSRWSTLRLRTGLSYASRESPSSGDRSRDWLFQYEGQLWREGDRVITGFTFTGKALLTSPGTSDHDVALSVMGNWNRIQPGILIGTELDPLFDRTELVPYAGLTLSVSVGRF